jgi:asparagine synthase (glutamine-hydrolysing)
VVAAGVAEVLGIEMPVFPKRRFQHGAASEAAFAARLAIDPEEYRRHFLSLHATCTSAGS